VHNFFAATGAAAAHLIEYRLTMTRVLCLVSRAHTSKVARRTKTTISSAFLRFTQTFAEIPQHENACTPRRASMPDHRLILLRAAALTHKIKRSHCYFSPAVVIRLQCGSIRDCTKPRSPSTLRLGGQQWRRREKRRKRQRRPRSVGRRSSQSRNRSSASHVSKVASHGPADVEADHHLPRRAGSGGQRGRRRDAGASFVTRAR
jgi:hypothetical protein